MDQSPYLVQALQSLQQAPQPVQQPQVDPQQLARALKQRKAWETANPGQSYAGHNVAQMGQNLMAAPGNVMQAAQQAPGNVMGAMKGLGGMFGGR